MAHAVRQLDAALPARGPPRAGPDHAGALGGWALPWQRERDGIRGRDLRLALEELRHAIGGDQAWRPGPPPPPKRPPPGGGGHPRRDPPGVRHAPPPGGRDATP